MTRYFVAHRPAGGWAALTIAQVSIHTDERRAMAEFTTARANGRDVRWAEGSGTAAEVALRIRVAAAT